MHVADNGIANERELPDMGALERSAFAGHQAEAMGAISGNGMAQQDTRANQGMAPAGQAYGFS